MLHKPLTANRLGRLRLDIQQAEVAARRCLDAVSTAINATDGSVTPKHVASLRHDAERTRMQLANLIAAIDAKGGV